MTLDEYVKSLETHVDSDLVHAIKDWPTDTKLYIYLHNIQLDRMLQFEQMLLDMKNEV